VRAHCIDGALRTWVFVWRGGCFHAGAETISISSKKKDGTREALALAIGNK
jgi:hypothetical protein